ncbi:MAG TPA: exo-alpha-sialidase, partial [Chthonomonadaceae bacterium]|nr:exo-alpha-sialidase [Chthonomonadaceae bacterium]
MRSRPLIRLGLAGVALLALACAPPGGAQSLPAGLQAHLNDPHIANPFVGWYRADVHPSDRPPYKPSGGILPMTSSLVNILVNNPSADGSSAQDTQSETCTLVFGSNVLVGYNDSTAYTSFVQNAHFTGYSLSTDGGNTFTDEGTLPQDTNGDLGDPALAADTVAGTIYFITIAFGEEFGVPGIQSFRSFDGGATFHSPVNAAPGFSSSDFLDKPWVAVDDASGTGQGTVYVTFTDFGSSTKICVTRSTDGGATWGPSGGVSLASGTVQGSYVVVGPDHSVYVFWLDGNSASQQILVRKSTDGGNTFGSSVTVATLKTTGVNGDLGLGGFRSNAFPHAAVNPVTGNVYVTYNDTPGGTDRADIFFTQSTDGGATWSAPVRVNDDTTTNDQWQPAIAVSPDGTQVFVGFYDRRLDSSNYMIDTFGSVGVISGSTVTFQPNFRITTASFPPVYGVDPVVNSTYMGDYDKADADNAFFYYSWGDNRLPSAGHSGDNADVRLTLIPISNFYITSLSPNSATAGGPGFTLTVNGNNFQSGATANWNGSALTTTFVSGNQLTASVPASDITSPGIAFVTVTNPDGTKTGPATFSIEAPAISSLSPNSATAGGSGFTLTVNGNNYLSGAAVNWNGSALTTTFVSGNQLTASVPASDIATAGTANITVTNPGGATSSSATFTIDNPVPSASSLSPSSTYVGSGAFTLTVNGSSFVSSSVVTWNGNALTTTYVSSTQVTASVPAIDVANVGSASVQVLNPTPGGGAS